MLLACEALRRTKLSGQNVDNAINVLSWFNSKCWCLLNHGHSKMAENFAGKPNSVIGYRLKLKKFFEDFFIQALSY